MKRTLFALAALLLASPILQACSAAQANQQTFVTHNCGREWKQIDAGEVIPTLVGMCAYKVTIPAYPMPGETAFKTSFADKVRVNVDIAYEYEIIDGRTFLSEAKYIGRMNSDADDAANSSKAYESAENTVIDKRLREAVGNLVVGQDIVAFDQGAFEDQLLVEANKMLANRGVRLNFIAFVPTPDTQTRQAIDVATAAKIYEANGLGSAGVQIMAARAGAPQITTNVDARKPPAEE